mgnify:CR=1 FL=1
MKRINTLKKLGLTASLAAIAASAGAAPPTDGDFDSGWGNNFGRTSIAFDFGGTKQDITADSVVGTDGAMYLAGTVRDVNGNPRIGLTKLLPISGAVDVNGFGTGGRVVSPAGLHATGLAMRNNTLYVGGYQDGPNNGKKFAVCVFNTSGVPLIFQGPGTSCVTATFALSPASAQHIANDIAIQADGKIVLGGYIAGIDNGRYSAFVRFNTNGILDNTFGLSNSGIQVVRGQQFTSEEVNAIGIASNGKIVGVGASQINGDSVSTSSSLLVRVTASGQVDPICPQEQYAIDFDGSGNRSTIFNDMVLVPSDGPEDKVVAVGSTELSANEPSGVIAKMGNCALDAIDFSGGDGTNGYSLVSPVSGGKVRFDAITRQPGNYFVVAGTVSSPNLPDTDVLVTRYAYNGSTTSNPLGKLIDFALPGGGFDEAVDVEVAGDAVYVAGWGTTGDGINVDYVAAKLVLDRIFADDFE